MRQTQASKKAFKFAFAFLALLLLFSFTGCATSAPGSRWITLFDGGSVGSFRGFHMHEFPTNKWTVENKNLKSIPGRGTDLITVNKYKDFELTLDWKVSKGANSGVMYGVTEASPETHWSGPEMQINDDPNHPDGKNPITAAGALYDLIPCNSTKLLVPTGEWNHLKIVSKGGHIEHWLNGAKILEYEWNSPSTRELINKSKFKDAPYFMKELNGHIALQHHGDEVWFRNIRIRRL